MVDEPVLIFTILLAISDGWIGEKALLDFDFHWPCFS
jgi:hypothetical protein